MKQKTGQILGFIVGVALAIGLDQWTKYLAVAGLKGKDAYVIWNGVFELQYLENRGAAFGMMQGKQFFFLFAQQRKIRPALQNFSQMFFSSIRPANFPALYSQVIDLPG